MTSTKRFANAAEQSFSFLGDAGLHLVRRGPAQLEYENAHVFVTSEWDARSGELNVFIGLQPKKGEPRNAFALGDVLRSQGLTMQEATTPFQVADENRLAPFLEVLANDMRAHAQAALAGDRMFFRRLEAFRGRQSEAYMRAMNLRRVRAEADEAWRSRDLARVSELYASIEDELTESERGRLAYATKHVSK